MANKNNLKLSVYEFFYNCVKKNDPHKAVGVITNKQFLFYSQLEPEEVDYTPLGVWPDHWGMASLLHKEINPNDKRNFYDNDYPDDIHIFSMGYDLAIDLPASGRLSKMQADYLIDILNAIESINNEITDDFMKIRVSFFCYNNKYEHVNFESHDIDAMKKAVLDSITKDIYIREEEIVGKTLDDKKIIEDLKYHLNPSYCKTSKDLVNYMFKIRTYYLDDYFKTFMSSIIQNYEKTINLINIIKLIDIEIPLISLENMEEDLENIILNMFNHISLANLISLSRASELDIENIEKYYPNFSLVADVIKKVSRDNMGMNFGLLMDDLNLQSTFEERLNNVTNYHELLDLVSSLTSDLLEKKENDLISTKESYDRQKMMKHIQKERTNIDLLINRYQELKSLIAKIQDEEFKISLMLMNVNISPTKRDLLVKRQDKLNEKIELFNKLISDIEHVFIEVTGLDAIYLNSQLISYYYDTDCSYIDYYQNMIMELEKEIDELRGFQDRFINDNIIDEEIETSEVKK